MRAVLLLCAGLFIGLNSAHAQTAQPAVPIDRQLPDYPEAAGGAEGYVKLHFTIAKDGHVTDPAVIESNPAGVFDAAAITGLKQWTYRPRLVDGHPVDQSDNVIVVRFKPPLDSQPVWLNPEKPLYPRQAFDAKIEGRVKVGFDITNLGTTANAHVLETTAPGVFDSEAITDVNGRIYQTVMINGIAQPAAGQSVVIEYKLADVKVRPKPTHIVKPVYPSEAANGGLIGFCAMDLSVADNGSVSNAVVEQALPRGVFEKSCMDAVKQWKFETSAQLGVPVSQHVKYKFDFRFPGQAERDVHYLKPGQWIELDYTMTVDGRAKDITLVAQSQPDLPVYKAVHQLKEMKFDPIVQNGVAVEKQHVKIKIQ
jgi:TonB family protein